MKKSMRGKTRPKTKAPISDRPDTVIQAPSAKEDVVLKTRAKTAKGRRELKKRDPKVHEAPKSALIMRMGSRSTPHILQVIKDINAVKSPFTVWQHKQQEVEMRPIDGDRERLNKLCEKNQTALFLGGTSTKKRRNRLTFGRQYDGQVLDIAEFEVSNFFGLSSFKGLQPLSGSMPLVVCLGSEFESSDAMIHIRNLLTDFFRGPNVDVLPIDDIQQLIVLTALRKPTDVIPTTPIRRPTTGTDAVASEVVISFRRYKISGALKTVDHARLTECGPSFDLRLDRFELPVKEVWKRSLQIPREIKPRKVKNVKTSALGDTIGKIYIPKQNLTELYTPHAAIARKKAAAEKRAMKDNA